MPEPHQTVVAALAACHLLGRDPIPKVDLQRRFWTRYQEVPYQEVLIKQLPQTKPSSFHEHRGLQCRRGARWLVQGMLPVQGMLLVREGKAETDAEG